MRIKMDREKLIKFLKSEGLEGVLKAIDFKVHDGEGGLGMTEVFTLAKYGYSVSNIDEMTDKFVELFRKLASEGNVDEIEKIAKTIVFVRRIYDRIKEAALEDRWEGAEPGWDEDDEFANEWYSNE